MGIRKVLSVLGVAATALTGVVLASGPAGASSGGGCSGVNDGVKACISASGGQVDYDMYVTSVPAGCSNMAITILNLSTTKQDTLYTGCGTGHFGMFSVAGLNNDTYVSYVTVFFGNDTQSDPATSPYLYFSD